MDDLLALLAEVPDAEKAHLISLAHSDRPSLTAHLTDSYPTIKLGRRKRLELELRKLPLGASSVVVTSDESVPLGLRIAWLRAAPPNERHTFASLLVGEDDDGDQLRSTDASALVPGGALLSRHCFALRSGSGGGVVGYAEILLVRVPPPAQVEPNACRFCWGDDHGDWLDPTLAADAAARAVAHGDTTTAASLPVGTLMHQPCACRGSQGSVHEGCLVAYLAATAHRSVGMSLEELKCPTCRQPYVGRASTLLAGCAAAVRAARAATDEATCAVAEGMGEVEIAGDAALAAAEGRVNEASTLCIRVHAHTHTQTCVHAYMHTCIHAYMHTCIHAYIRIRQQGERAVEVWPSERGDRTLWASTRDATSHATPGRPTPGSAESGA